MRLSILLICFLFVCLNSYSQKEVTIKFVHKVGNEILKLDETEFTIWNGKKMIINRAEFYLTGIKVANSEHEVQNFEEVVLLINANDEGRAITIGELEGNMVPKKFMMSFGIDSTNNHGDPSLYPESHPLSLKLPSMHWGWVGGYRFLVVEGKVDQNGDGIPETDFGFHNLGDDLYKEVQIELDSISSNNMNLVLSLDYIKLFDKLTLIGNTQVHGSGAKNLQMIANATTGGFVSLDKTISAVNDDKISNNYFNVISDAEGINIITSDLICDGCNFYIHDITGKLVASFAMRESNRKLLVSKQHLMANQLYVISLYKDNFRLQGAKVMTH